MTCPRTAHTHTLGITMAWQLPLVRIMEIDMTLVGGNRVRAPSQAPRRQRRFDNTDPGRLGHQRLPRPAPHDIVARMAAF